MISENAHETYCQLLSTDDISVRYSNHAVTASFFTDEDGRKCVVMPTFEYLDDLQKQLMIAHEVGHAIWSDYSKDELQEYKAKYGPIFNIIEDIRIENLLKKRFPGLGEIFSEGYDRLFQNGLFGKDLQDRTPEFHFFDRINLKFKIGHVLDIPFSSQESEYVYQCYDLITKEQVIDLCDSLLKFRADSPKEKETKVLEDSESVQTIKDPKTGNPDSKPGSSVEEFESNLESEQAKYEQEKEDLYEKFMSDPSESNEQFKDFDNKRKISDVHIDISLNGVNLSEFVRDNIKYQKFALNFINTDESPETKKFRNKMTSRIKKLKKISHSGDIYFRMLKSAKAARNVRQKQTGILDPRRLAKYKVSDKLFKSKAIVEKEQNHGVVIFIDYSGSITSLLNDIIDEAILTCEFCRNNGIKFEVFAFGGYLGIENNAPNLLKYDGARSYIIKIADDLTYCPEYLFMYTRSFQNYISKCRYAILQKGQANSKEYDAGSINILYNQMYYCGRTPIIRSAVLANSVIQRMIARGVSKSHIVFITDGDNSDYYIPMHIRKSKSVLAFAEYRKNLRKREYKNDQELIADIMAYNAVPDTCSVTVSGFKNTIRNSGIIADNIIGTIFSYIKKMYGTEILYSYITKSSKYFFSYYSILGSVFCSDEECEKLADILNHHDLSESPFIGELEETETIDKIIICKGKENSDSNGSLPKNKMRSLENLYSESNRITLYIKELAKTIA